jgi:streptogramin lyase
VTRIDPHTYAVVATTKACSGPSDGARGPDGLEWIPCNGDGTIVRIDPATNAVVDTLPAVTKPFVVRSAFGAMWAGDFGGATLWRYAP